MPSLAPRLVRLATTFILRRVLCALTSLALPACGPPDSVPAEIVLRSLGEHAGKRVTIRGRFRSGARCRQGADGEWKTYCKDCQFCRGPIVLDTGSSTVAVAADDWPMILGGTWENKDIRCKGPLGKIECHPFEMGKTYVVRGVIERQRPPKLLVEKFWRLD